MKQRDLFTEEERQIFYKSTGTRLKQHLVSEDRFQEINMNFNTNIFDNDYVRP